MKIYSAPINYHCTIHQSKKNLPYLLLLHGFMGSEQSFRHLIEPLAKFCNPVTIDLAGHGQSGRTHEPNHYSAQKQASDIHSILSRLGREPWNLYGYSMGGRLVYQLITHFPDWFQSAFIESAHCGINGFKERFERKRDDEQKALKIESDYKSFLESWNKNPLFSQTETAMTSHYNKQMEEQDPPSMAASLRGFGAGVMPSVCESIHEISFPVYLISGENDKKYVDLSEKIQSGGSTFTHHIIPKAGHRVHLDQPHLLIEFIQSKLNSTRS